METIHSFTPVWIILTSSVAALLIALLGRWPNVRESCIFAAAAIKLGLLLSLAPAVLDGKLYGKLMITAMLRDWSLDDDYSKNDGFFVSCVLDMDYFLNPSGSRNVATTYDD
jgi:hypothetical protein